MEPGVERGDAIRARNAQVNEVPPLLLTLRALHPLLVEFGQLLMRGLSELGKLAQGRLVDVVVNLRQPEGTGVVFLEQVPICLPKGRKYT